MRDSTYVVIALALCSLVMLAMSMQKPKAMYMLDLEDFKALPVELRSALRRMLPDPVAVRQKWAHMTPDQKRTAIQHLGGFMQRPQQDTNDVEPEPVDETDPEPELVDDTDPEPEPVDVAEPEPEPAPVEPEPAPRLDTVKKGKKKDTKNKKENEVIALGAIGTDVSLNGSGPSGGFLGRDD
jgi:hypothetical protein